MQMNTESTTPLHYLRNSFHAFFKMEAAGGIALMSCTVIALLWANSIWADTYHALWQTKLTIGAGDWILAKPAILWINDGLMAIFFFMVGLEIKREILAGDLSTPRQTIMPVAAAIGGMVVPALIFLIFNTGSPSVSGWGIPMATDIAFALGILSLLGSRVPVGLTIFLTALAIVDDIGAILVIAVCYTSALNLAALAIGLAILGLMGLMNIRWGIRRTLPYLILGIIVWFAFLKSGIHATIAGVLAAMTIPASTRMDGTRFVQELRHTIGVFERATKPDSTILTCTEQQTAMHALAHAHDMATTPLQNIEHALHPWVAFCIMPLFALANAGVTFQPELMQDLFAPVSLGVFFGLVIGKQIGVTGACWLMAGLGLARYPDRTTLLHIYGASCLAGVGFTMSIFIANLAYPAAPQIIELAKIAILFASLAAGIWGYVILRLLTPKKPETRGNA